MKVNKRDARLRRARKTRAKAKKFAVERGTPRLSVHRSNKNISGQILDPHTGDVIAQVSSLQLKTSDAAKAAGKIEVCKLAGRTLGQKAKEKGLSGKLTSDLSGFKYHGRVAAFLEGLREVKELEV